MKNEQVMLAFLIILLSNTVQSYKVRTHYNANDDISAGMTEREKNTDTEEGDMKLTPEQEMAERGIVQLDFALEDLSKWPSSTIPYVFGDGFDGADDMQKAFNEYKEKSCIRFREKRPEDKDYLYFYNGRGCWSFVGRIGGKQHISLPHYCRTTNGTPVHEILHALGFYHEQSRADRDQYIKVEWKNIKSRAKQNFEEHEAQDHGYPYDYDSVMHYSSHAFSKNGQITLKVLKANVDIGQRRGMSKIDALQLNAHYCGGKEGGNKKRESVSKSGMPSRKIILCNPEEGEVCDDINSLNAEDLTSVLTADAAKLPCNPEEGEVCEDELTKNEEYHSSPAADATQLPCKPEDGEECCAKLYDGGYCYLCNVATKCSKTCQIPDKDEKCGNWVKHCAKETYRNWMSKNCATSCKDKCTKE